MASGKTDRSSGDGDTLRDVVTLDDLAPRHDVRGGSGRRVFGADTKAFANESNNNHQERPMATKKNVKKDLQPKKSPKAGLKRY